MSAVAPVSVSGTVRSSADVSVVAGWVSRATEIQPSSYGLQDLVPVQSANIWYRYNQLISGVGAKARGAAYGLSVLGKGDAGC